MDTIEIRHKVHVSIEGMTCSSCARRVERALQALPGVENVSVDLSAGQATLACEDSNTEQLKQAVEQAGYKVSEIR